MTGLQRLLAFVRVVLTAAPTWITLAVSVLMFAADEIAKVFPGGAGEKAAAVCISIASALTGILALIYRLSPVPKTQRGFLPKSGRDTGAILVGCVAQLLAIMYIAAAAVLLIRIYLS